MPKDTSLVRLKADKPTFMAKRKEQSTQTTGYQLQCGLNTSITGAKVATVSGAEKTLAKVPEGLKSGKRYYVRIRAFKIVALRGF